MVLEAILFLSASERLNLRVVAVLKHTILAALGEHELLVFPVVESLAQNDGFSLVAGARSLLVNASELPVSDYLSRRQADFATCQNIKRAKVQVFKRFFPRFTPSECLMPGLADVRN